MAKMDVAQAFDGDGNVYVAGNTNGALHRLRRRKWLT
jgi:hypothetical protein